MYYGCDVAYNRTPNRTPATYDIDGIFLIAGVHCRSMTHKISTMYRRMLLHIIHTLLGLDVAVDYSAVPGVNNIFMWIF